MPLLTAIVLIVAGAHEVGPLWTGGTSVWTAASSSYDPDGIFIALPAAGIVFSFLGFRTAIDLGGESANPGRNIPLAVIGAVLLSAFVYILLQLGFLNSVKPQDIAEGWGQLNFPGVKGPFAGLAMVLGFGWLATLALHRCSHLAGRHRPDLCDGWLANPFRQRRNESRPARADQAQQRTGALGFGGGHVGHGGDLPSALPSVAEDGRLHQRHYRAHVWSRADRALDPSP